MHSASGPSAKGKVSSNGVKGAASAGQKRSYNPLSSVDDEAAGSYS